MQTFVNIMGRVSVFLGKACGLFYLAAIGLSVLRGGDALCLRCAYVLDIGNNHGTGCCTAWLFCVGAVTQQRRHITVTTMELVVGPCSSGGV